MAQKISPFVDGKFGWNFGESGWNDGMDENIVKFSFLFNRNVDAIVSTLPTSPANGSAYFNTSDSRFYFRVDNRWFSSPVPEWFTFQNKATGEVYQYNGTSASQIDSNTDLSTRLDDVELTIATLGSAAFQDSSAFATQTELDLVEGQAQAYTDSLISSLSSSTGTDLVGYDGGTLTEFLSDLSSASTISVKDFGAVGDGTTDDSAAIQAAVDEALAQRAIVSFPAGEYLLNSKIEIRNGVAGIRGDGGIVKIGAITGGFRLRGIRSGEAQNVSRFVCSGLKVDAQNLEGGSGMKVFDCENVQYCTFINNQIYNMQHGYAINLFSYATGVTLTRNNVVVNNTITGIPGITKDSTGVRWYAVSLSSDLDFTGYDDPVAKYIDGAGVATGYTTCDNNTVSNNRIDGGYYGITLISATRNLVAGNSVRNNIRGIALEWGASYNSVTDNRVNRNVSTGILAGYGCSHNTIHNNSIFTEDQWIGEALIKVGLSSTRNSIQGNHTQTNNNVETGEYHIYIHLDASWNIVANNVLNGDCARAYIGVESAWNSTVTDTAHFAQGKGSSLNTYSVANTSNVCVINNTILEQSTKATVPPAIYFGQINDTNGNRALSNCVIANNRITSLKHSSQLKVIEMTSGFFQLNMLKDNAFERQSNATHFSLPRYRQHFVESEGNVFIDAVRYVINLPTADTSPSVGYGNSFSLVNTSATSVTTFDDGFDGQEIQVRLDAFTTLVHNNAVMRLKGGVNVAPSNANNFIRLRRESGVWFEVGRSF